MKVKVLAPADSALELRNLIYEECLEDWSGLEVNLLYRCPFSTFLFPGTEAGGALTQVSQQVRHEFYKQYLGSRDFAVWIVDLPAYMDVWLESAAASGTTLTIEMEGVVRATDCLRPIPKSMQVDITKVCQLRHVYPDFNFHVSHSQPEDPKYTESKDLPEHPAKDNLCYFESAMSKIMIEVVDWFNLVFHFQLKNPDDADWFETRTDGEKILRREKRSDLVHWIDDVLVQSWEGVAFETGLSVY